VTLTPTSCLLRDCFFRLNRRSFNKNRSNHETLLFFTSPLFLLQVFWFLINCHGLDRPRLVGQLLIFLPRFSRFFPHLVYQSISVRAGFVWSQYVCAFYFSSTVGCLSGFAECQAHSLFFQMRLMEVRSTFFTNLASPPSSFSAASARFTATLC